MPETEIDEIDAEQEGDSPQIADLRRRNRELAKKAKRLDEVEQKLAKVERDKVLDSTEFADLKPKQREALAKLHEGEFTADALKATAIELGFVVDTESEEISNELDQHERVAGAAQTSKTPNTGMLKPEDVADWPMDRLLRLRQNNPDAFEALKRGESVMAANVA